MLRCQCKSTKRGHDLSPDGPGGEGRRHFSIEEQRDHYELGPGARAAGPESSPAAGRDRRGFPMLANRAGRRLRRRLSLPGRAGLAGFALAAGLLGLAWPASSGDPADLKARGKLVMLTFPVQGGFFDVVNVDLMREQGLTFKDLHKPEQFSGIDVDVMNGFARSLG